MDKPVNLLLVLQEKSDCNAYLDTHAPYYQPLFTAARTNVNSAISNEQLGAYLADILKHPIKKITHSTVIGFLNVAQQERKYRKKIFYEVLLGQDKKLTFSQLSALEFYVQVYHGI